MEEVLTVQSGSLAMEILPNLSGRVKALTHGGRNLLSGPDAHPDNWGATYWTTPQSDWGWPPVPRVDGEGYQVLQSKAAVSLRSEVASFARRSFIVEKHFRPGPRAGCIDVEYVLENQGAEAFVMGGWEISRVPPGGLTFFPTGEWELSPVAPHCFMPTEKAFGTTFYDHAEFRAGECLKYHADGKLGYLAHVIDNILLLKLFTDSTPDQMAPGEGECELFANDDGNYVEIEVQGGYGALLPGGRSNFLVRTVTVELPAGLARKDKAELRRFADEQAQVFR